MSEGLGDSSYIMSLVVTPTSPPVLFAGTENRSVWKYIIEEK
jgi:hypothetical protein